MDMRMLVLEGEEGEGDMGLVRLVGLVWFGLVGLDWDNEVVSTFVHCLFYSLCMRVLFITHHVHFRGRSETYICTLHTRTHTTSQPTVPKGS